MKKSTHFLIQIGLWTAIICILIMLASCGQKHYQQKKVWKVSKAEQTTVDRKVNKKGLRQ